MSPFWLSLRRGEASPGVWKGRFRAACDDLPLLADSRDSGSLGVTATRAAMNRSFAQSAQISRERVNRLRPYISSTAATLIAVLERLSR